ncbi:MAG: glutamate--tRNA ligase [Clostridiales bacterium]|nr:glutamate--tRNA ligase [Clostridiales bacterium]
MTESQKIAALVFEKINKTPDDYYKMYPARNLSKKSKVTRFAPSPTGFLHIGGLFASLISERLAHQSEGVFFLRIEDTDKKREVTDGVTGIIQGLTSFDIQIDEGIIGFQKESGDYGPYLQSERALIYQAFAKSLMERGLAYPCFCTEEELTKIRERQESDKLLPGYYGNFAKCRNLPQEEVEQKIKAGLPFVVRLKSQGTENGKIKFKDGIKGEIEMPQNISDIVLLKSDGIPTYHFAHVVDDTLMHTTDVVRGDEWISSVPVHLELFSAIGQPCPKYAHIAPIMKESEDGGKRKISKRKDPEAAVSYFLDEGYPPEAVIEYLLNLANYNFEDWRRQNPGASIDEFPFDIKKMSPSGALFDLVKLNDVSKTVISQMTAEHVLSSVLDWSKNQDQDLYTALSSDPDYGLAIFSIDRGGEKPRKDLVKWSDVKNYVSYFYDTLFDKRYDIPENIQKDDIKAIVDYYKGLYDSNDDKDIWFQKIKNLCGPFGYASEVKIYKKNPEAYKGHIGDISNIIRIAITGRRQTPDLYAISNLLGKSRVISRLEQFLGFIGEEAK